MTTSIRKTRRSALFMFAATLTLMLTGVGVLLNISRFSR